MASWPANPWLRRLPLLLVLGGGWALWKGPWFPQERAIVWQLPAAPLSRVEIQLWEGDRLLKREQRVSVQASGGEWAQKVYLRPGDYRVEVFAERASGERLHEQRALHMGSEETVTLPLLSR